MKRVLFAVMAFSFSVWATEDLPGQADLDAALAADTQLKALAIRMLEPVEKTRLGPEASTAMGTMLELQSQYENHLLRAAQANNAVGIYLLADLAERNGRFDQACSLYQEAAGKQLLAGLVAVVRCSSTLHLSADEQVRRAGALIEALKRSDPYTAYYPLPTSASYCVANAVDRDATRQKYKESFRLDSLSLSETQYRAEAQYLLAFSEGLDTRDAWLRVARKLAGCNDLPILQALLR